MFWHASVLPSIHLSVHRGGQVQPGGEGWVRSSCRGEGWVSEGEGWVSRGEGWVSRGEGWVSGGRGGSAGEEGGSAGGGVGQPGGRGGSAEGGRGGSAWPAVCLLRSRRRTFLFTICLIGKKENWICCWHHYLSKWLGKRGGISSSIQNLQCGSISYKYMGYIQTELMTCCLGRKCQNLVLFQENIQFLCLCFGG